MPTQKPPRPAQPPLELRRTSRIVATSPGCEPLRAAYAAAVVKKPKAWEDVEDLFLRGMEGLDANIASGVAKMGDLQNGKGDFFNDLIALLLENCADVQLWSRRSVPGLIIPTNNLDVTYPNSDPIEFVLEAKAVGTPRHPGSPKQKAIGRQGSADLAKRIKEVGFKTIDLKAEYARNMTSSGTSPAAMSGDFVTWLHSVKPRSYLFVAARVTTDRDREQVFRYARRARFVSDDVGVFCFRPVSEASPTTYRAERVDDDLELSRALFRACRALTSIREAREPTR